MQIQQQYKLEVFIDNLNIFNYGAVLQEANLFEALDTPVPCCDISVIVPTDWMDSRSIVDGSVIRFELEGKLYNKKYSDKYSYRLYSIDKVELNGKYVTLKIRGVLDFYEGYTSGNKYNMYGSTCEVFKSIAEKNNLNYNLDATNDRQLWIAGENNTYGFLQMMTERAWRDQTSAMFWAFDRYKTLLYKNITGLFAQRSDELYTFIQTETPNSQKNIFGYTSSEAKSFSGFENIHNCGYGGTNFYFDLLEYKQKEVDAKKVIAWSNFFNINKELSRGLYDNFYGFDVGNQHKMYNVAKIQNKRILSTYSTYVTLSSQFFQPYRLGQIVNFSYTDAQNIKFKIKSFSGLFIISAIKINITTKAITSMVELSMQGLNGQAITQEVF